MSRVAAAAQQVPEQWGAGDLARIAEVCERAAAGDLEARIVGVDVEGDLARVCRAINAMLDAADSFVREASASMESCSHERFHRPILLRGLKGAYRTSAATINRAGIKMRDSREKIRFVNSVAAACAELSASSSEIARLTAESAQLTQSTVSEAAKATEAVGALSDAVRKVDGILALIIKVAAQTNLLALNATIEAARAGEHGKGFAVVATEVKDLSRSTATATQEIGAQIERMQHVAQWVAGFIDGIGRSIGQIDDGATAIARAIDEQVKAISEIDRMISEISEKSR